MFTDEFKNVVFPVFILFILLTGMLYLAIPAEIVPQPQTDEECTVLVHNEDGSVDNNITWDGEGYEDATVYNPYNGQYLEYRGCEAPDNAGTGS